jgi:hypothetical protein
MERKTEKEKIELPRELGAAAQGCQNAPYYDVAGLFIGKNCLVCFQRLPFLMIWNLKIT